MKKQLLTAVVIALAGFNARAQVVTDTVILGASYANQVWYSLSDDEQGSQPKNNWDLGFQVAGSMGSSILVNATGSGAVWLYPKSDKSGWSTVDTTGLSTWPKQFNAETEWTGALGRYNTGGMDLGWGVYDLTTHFVNGDSIYIIKTQGGNFKKLFIEKLAGGIYTFKYANLDGSSETSKTLSKTAYADKNFGYYSLDANAAVDREPIAEDWDLTFCQYNTDDYAGMGMPGYVVTGVLQNTGAEAVLAKVDPSLRAGYTSYTAHTMSPDINGIGYNWKTFTGGVYVYNDSAVYFVKSMKGDIWKVIMKQFISGSGGGNGSVIFSKEKLYDAVSVANTVKENTTVLVSPNPAATGQNINIVYDFRQAVEHATLTVTDIMGRTMATATLQINSGMHVYTLPTAGLTPGMYIVNIAADQQQLQYKIIVQ